MKLNVRPIQIAVGFSLFLTSCSTYSSLGQLTRHVDDHATSSQGAGFDVYVNKTEPTFEVALDLRSAATAAVAWMPPKAEFDSVAQHWIVMNHPRCQAKPTGQVSAGRFKYRIEC
jgi:hypothetical protein